MVAGARRNPELFGALFEFIARVALIDAPWFQCRFVDLVVFFDVDGSPDFPVKA